MMINWGNLNILIFIGLYYNFDLALQQAGGCFLRIKNIFKNLYISMILAFVLNLVLPWIAIPKMEAFSFYYIKYRPFWSGTLILFLLMNVFFFFKKAWYYVMSFFLFAILLCYGYANGIKMEKRSDPIVPNDFYLLKESWAMSKQYLSWQQFLILAIGILLLGITAYLILKKKWDTTTPFASRVLISLTSAALLFGFGSIRDNRIWNLFGVSNAITLPSQNLIDNGFVMGNLMQLTMLYQQKPEGYSKTAVEKYIEELKTSESAIASTKNVNGVKPNVIVLQLEAFFDPTTLPNITLSEDPIPFFHSLQNQYSHGQLGVNVFGAGTANTEFEVLTSMSLQLFPYETHPYTSHVNQPVDSVAYRFKQHGYKTSFLHNNYGWFYKRENVLPRLGFDHLMFSEQMWEKDTESVYDVPAVPKDYVLFDNIIKRTEKTKEKDFILGVTMELHGPYVKWYDHDIKITSDTVDKQYTDIIEEYVFKLKEVDKALQRLIQYYENSNEPTMIVMYGDHLPWLGDDRVVYYETGYSNKTFEERHKMYSTPYIVWDNYRQEETKQVNLGSTFLVPYVFREIGINGNGLHTFLQEKMDEGVYQLGPADDRKQEGWTSKSEMEYRYLQYYYLNEPSMVKK
jgi:phosphoglycerol transferase MdoB-like AlkP superfamily enzyme